MSDIITKVLPGFMELLPEEQIEFDRIKSVILETYQQFGFTAIDTPVIERSSTLLAKAGGETEKQIYSVENKRGVGAGNFDESGRADLSLRFDLTVPLARYVAEHFSSLSFPFRRCHLAKVYRGERPQKGRFREFYQCDIDVIGKDSLNIMYDAEIPSIIYQLFKRLDFGKFTIRINNRKLLNGLIEAVDSNIEVAEVLRIIDKVEKISKEDFVLCLKDLNLSDKSIDLICRFISINGTVEKVLAELNSLGIDNELFKIGVEELSTVTSLMSKMGVDSSYFMIDLSIARGLDYYTGTVYETKLDDYPKLGSVCSGGRFDNLASYYTNEKLPGVGISIGLTRLFYQLREIGIVSCTHKTIANVVVVPMSDSNILYSLKVAAMLREKGYCVDVLLEDLSTKKKFQYVSKKDPVYTIVIGEEEEQENNVKLQYRSDGELVKTTVSISELFDYLSL